MPCTPNTSSESSYPILRLSQVQAQKQIAPAMIPISTPCIGRTKPDAGVIVPRPAIAPEIIPSTDGLPRVHHSSAIHVNAPALAARCVDTIALAAPGAGGVGAGGRGGGGVGAGRRAAVESEPADP